MEEIVACILARNTDKISAAIESGKFKVNKLISSDRSALAQAASCGYIDVMLCLLDHDADINLSDGGELAYTPIESAARNGQLDAVKLLVERGAEIDKENSIGSTALIGACISAHQDILLYLIQSGATINHADNQGQTALHYLCRYAKHWDGNVITQTIDGKTPALLNTKFQDYTKVFNTLLEKSADVNLLTGYGYTPLHLAAESNTPSFIQALFGKGAVVNAQNAKGFSPLHAASDKGNLEACIELIACGADINIIDKDGFTPILGATAAHQLELVALLLAHGAKTTTAAKVAYGNVQVGDNALSLAVRLENEELLALFF
jgi:ankyrin repeat protein